MREATQLATLLFLGCNFMNSKPYFNVIDDAFVTSGGLIFSAELNHTSV